MAIFEMGGHIVNPMPVCCGYMLRLKLNLKPWGRQSNLSELWQISGKKRSLALKYCTAVACYMLDSQISGSLQNLNRSAVSALTFLIDQ